MIRRVSPVGRCRVWWEALPEPMHRELPPIPGAPRARSNHRVVDRCPRRDPQLAARPAHRHAPAVNWAAVFDRAAPCRIAAASSSQRERQAGQQYGKLFADSPDLSLTITNRMTAGKFVVDEEHVSGLRFGDMPTEIMALSVYQVTDGKISKLMLLF
jgi:hypothetical protein